MNIKITPKEIGLLLDRSSNQLDNRTLDGLRNARQLALQHQHHATSVWVDWRGLLHAHGERQQRMLNWFVAGILAALLLGGLAYWQKKMEQSPGDIDIAILTDEMPIEVYVD